MKNKIIVLLILIFASASCKKEEEKPESILNGDASILTGKWQWTHTVKIDDACLGGSYQYHDPASVGYDCVVSFFSSGSIFQSRTSGVYQDYKITSISSAGVDGVEYSFSIEVDIDHFGYPLRATVTQDSLVMNKFPVDYDYACDEVSNYYIRLE